MAGDVGRVDIRPFPVLAAEAIGMAQPSRAAQAGQQSIGFDGWPTHVDPQQAIGRLALRIPEIRVVVQAE